MFWLRFFKKLSFKVFFYGKKHQFSSRKTVKTYIFLKEIANKPRGGHSGNFRTGMLGYERRERTLFLRVIFECQP